MKLRNVLGFLLLVWGGAQVFGDFIEEFGTGWDERWDHSGEDMYKGVFVVDTPEESEDPGLKVPQEALHYGLAALLDEPMAVADGITVQYEARWASGHTCGGGYLKFFTHDEEFSGDSMVADTPYSIMFGPDKCGGTNKVHFILRHKNPIDGKYEEKHMISPPSVPSDRLTHVYTATLKTDNTVEILIDGKVVKEGSLFDILSPPINPPREIPDPSDVKPEDWVDEEKIPDSNATKPDDWVDDETIEDASAEKPIGWLDDEPDMIEDPSASMPEEWDIEEDGEWLPPVIPNPRCEAAPGCGEWKRPMIENPDYKGEWETPMIDNPAYKGEWVQKKIPNPKYFEDKNPLSNIGDIGAVGIEIWTMDKDIFFDNILVVADAETATKYQDIWVEKHTLEEAAEEVKKNSDAPQTSVGEFLQDIIENPALEFASQYLQPIVDYAKSDESAFIAILISIVITFFIMFSVMLCKCCCSRKPSRVDARASKKKDQTGPDDADDTGATSKKPTDEKLESEDEPTEESSGPRRRPRRDES